VRRLKAVMKEIAVKNRHRLHAALQQAASAPNIAPKLAG
jgi:hypothetical protein